MADTEAEKYEVLSKIGQGSFGIIRKVRRKSDGLVLCRKEICYSRMSQKEREQLQAELDILRRLRHPNIVAYYEREHLKASHDLHLYMEYCGNGDLGMMIKDLKAKHEFADEELVWTIFAQLVGALYRCHYGEDPPDVSSNTLGLTKNALPLKSKQAHHMILHRDLKPENVFLGDGNSVKLGDFGLSKIILSHDFASTYVGTPFYMSPEICAAERYSLFSDIWSLGCIIYELCAREPPFNARTHLELIQKIKIGKVAPLPRNYSKELSDVISACLQANPNARPDTASLLKLPRVKLVRKTQEGIMVLQQHITAKEHAIAALKAAHETIARLEGEKQAMHDQINNQLRLEWETRAQLEITRRSDAQETRLIEKYQSMFEQSVADEVQRRLASLPSSHTSSYNSSESAEQSHDEEAPIPRSSTPTADLDEQAQAPTLSTIGETEEDFASGTDMTALSLEESPLVQRHKPLKKTGRTPFTRARTFANANEVAPSPMDIHMADPSPMSIASLSLSPRRNAPLEGSKLRQPTFVRGPNSFDRAIRDSSIPLFPAESPEDEDTDSFDDDTGASPIRTRSGASNEDPFKVLAQPAARRPTMIRQSTMPVQSHMRLRSTPNLSATGSAHRPSPTLTNATNLERPPSASPGRTRLARGLPVSPSRKAPAAPAQASATAQQLTTASAAKKALKDDNMIKAVHRHNLVQGRTLVELAQARGIPTAMTASGGVVGVENVKVKGGDREPLWDPERDEMPSPFLVRHRRPVALPR